jgi:hypothetical protein
MPVGFLFEHNRVRELARRHGFTMAAPSRLDKDAPETRTRRRGPGCPDVLPSRRATPLRLQRIAREARKLHSLGLPATTITRKLGVTDKTVTKVIRSTWAEL